MLRRRTGNGRVGPFFLRMDFRGICIQSIQLLTEGLDNPGKVGMVQPFVFAERLQVTGSLRQRSSVKVFGAAFDGVGFPVDRSCVIVSDGILNDVKLLTAVVNEFLDQMNDKWLIVIEFRQGSCPIKRRMAGGRAGVRCGRWIGCCRIRKGCGMVRSR